MYTLDDINTILEDLSTLEEPNLIRSHFDANSSRLASFLKGTDNIGVTEIKVFIKVCEVYAYYGKFAEVRDLVTKFDAALFSDLCAFYTGSKDVLASEELQGEAQTLEIQLLRALGNLTIDDDSARQKVLDTGILAQIVTGLRGVKGGELRKVCTGCLLNITLGFSPARRAILSLDCFGALLPSLSRERLEAREFTTVYLCLELLANLFEEDNCLKLFSESYSNVQELINTLSFYTVNAGEFDVPIMNHLVDLIEASLNDNENFLPTLASDGSLKLLCDFLEASKTILGRYPQNKDQLATIVTTVERIIVLVSSYDANLVLFDDIGFMRRMSAWLSQTDNQLLSCAALVLGNLAWTDQNCTKMVQEQELHLKLVPLLEKATDLALQHAIVGALKNLSIPAENKRLLGTSCLIRTVAPLLEKQVAQPLQFGAAGLLKHLSDRNVGNALAMCSTENAVDGVLPISRLRNVINKSDDQGIRCEATRAIMNVVKAVYSTRDNFERFGKIIADNTVVQPIMDLVMQTKFPILQNEAIITLALLSSAQSPEVEAIVSALIETCSELPRSENGILTARDALEMVPLSKAIEDILLATGRPYATEMRLNALTFLEQIFNCRNSDTVALEKLRYRFLPALEYLVCETVDSLRASAEKIHGNYF